MSKQIFRRTVPLVILTGLLEEICLITEKYYLVDYNAYKKFMYNAEKKDDFIRTIHEYYHLSKKHYINREMTYNNFLTIIRQITRSHKLEYTSQIRYNESNYNIVYFIPQTM
jgi:hypothetical protein